MKNQTNNTNGCPKCPFMQASTVKCENIRFVEHWNKRWDEVLHEFDNNAPLIIAEQNAGKAYYIRISDDFPQCPKPTELINWERLNPKPTKTMVDVVAEFVELKEWQDKVIRDSADIVSVFSI